MFFSSWFKPKAPPQRTFVRYKVAACQYDAEKNRWKRIDGKGKAQKTTEIFKKNKGKLIAVGKAKPGDTLLLREQGGSLKQEGRYWIPMTNPRLDPLIAALRRFFTGPPKVKKAEDNELATEVTAVRVKIPNVQNTIRKIEKRYPDMAETLKEQDRKVNALLKEEQRLARSLLVYGAIPKVKVSEQLEEEVKKLQQIKTSAKAVLLAEEELSESDSEPEVKQLAEGAQKRVMTKKWEQKRVKTRASVYFVAQPSFGEKIAGTATKEIVAEVNISKKIKTELLRKGLTACLMEIYNERSATILADKLIDRFENVDGLEMGLKVFALSPEALAAELGIHLKGAKNILKVLPDKVENLRFMGNNLAIDLELVPKEEQIENKPTVKAPMAKRGDLEKAIRSKETTMEQRIGYGAGVLAATSDLHKAGFVHGDLKPENLLIFDEEIDGKQEEVVKLGDYGKVEERKDKRASMYLGNTRFAPYEGELSRKGEVYGTGLMLIRVFEEPFLRADSKMLVEELSKEKRDSVNPKADRQGVEKFVVVSKDMAQSESTLRGRVKVLSPSTPIYSRPKPEAAEKAIHVYIDTLTDKLITIEKREKKEAEALGALLKAMTLSNPSKRPTAEEAQAKYNHIFNL